MSPRLRLAVCLATLAGCGLPVQATAQTPNVWKVAVECQFKDGENHTVTVGTALQVGGPNVYRYRFHNTATGQDKDFQVFLVGPDPKSFAVPPGTYDLTVGYIPSGMSAPNPKQASALVVGIVVPPIRSTGGRGTGCQF